MDVLGAKELDLRMRFRPRREPERPSFTLAPGLESSLRKSSQNVIALLAAAALLSSIAYPAAAAVNSTAEEAAYLQPAPAAAAAATDADATMASGAQQQVPSRPEVPPWALASL